ncbi:hypothetical protein [Lysinibacillus agricola]|uniref:hypothetical protein n=1 Tax=Lysinibacillus agricola TaxID=2590012 RepID=UPI003C1FE2C7
MNSSFNCGCEENCSCSCCTPLKFKAVDACQIPQVKPCIPGPQAPQVVNKCFVDTHELFDNHMLLDGAETEVVFVDETCNHNKTLITVTSEQPSEGTGGAQPVQVTIQTKGCDRPLIAVITPSNTRAFQVENFESLTLTNLSSSFAQVEYSIQKTFCICCEDDDKRMFHSCDQGGELFIGKHILDIDVVFSQEPSSLILFEDFTCNHNKTLLKFNAFRAAAFTIKTRGCLPRTIIVEGNRLNPHDRVIQVENLESVSVTNLFSIQNFISLNGSKTFCISCPGKDNNRKCDSCCDKCNSCDNKNKCHTCKRCKKCSCSCNRMY